MLTNYMRPVNLYTLATYFSLAAIFTGCSIKHAAYNSPPHYDLNTPYIIKLPTELSEISGITYRSKDNSLFAESDEKGCLYKIFLNKPTDIRKWKFGHKRDYEDIVLLDSTFYILNNNGDITSLHFLEDSIATHEYTFPGTGKNEFEAMYYDDTLKKLVLLCKDCEADKDATVSSYSFDLQQFIYNSSYVIDAKDIAALTSPAALKYKPSGASVNPATGELYILSSINKLLVVADRNGKIKEVYHLDPSLFNQPEGITFSPNGNLFISNEGGKQQQATILFYQFKNADKK